MQTRGEREFIQSDSSVLHHYWYPTLCLTPKGAMIPSILLALGGNLIDGKLTFSLVMSQSFKVYFHRASINFMVLGHRFVSFSCSAMIFIVPFPHCWSSPLVGETVPRVLRGLKSSKLILCFILNLHWTSIPLQRFWVFASSTKISIFLQSNSYFSHKHFVEHLICKIVISYLLTWILSNTLSKGEISEWRRKESTMTKNEERSQYQQQQNNKPMGLWLSSYFKSLALSLIPI